MPDKANINLDSPVLELTGVGPTTERKLQQLGIHCIGDLLFHLPVKYQNRTQITRIDQLQEGKETLIEGLIESKSISYGGRRNLTCRLSDTSGTVQLRFFHFSKQQFEALRLGYKLQCFGTPRKRKNSFEFIHPEYKLGTAFSAFPKIETLTPVYPLTEGIHQRKISGLITTALNLLDNSRLESVELLPTPIRESFQLTNIVDSLRVIHSPPREATSDIDQFILPHLRRLAFEELLTQKIYLNQERKNNSLWHAHRIPYTDLKGNFLGQLNFSLTSDQLKVVSEIDHDLNHVIPMNRLLQGDVGSGKTVVAGSICASVVGNGYKAALMAPTELLAEQHHKTLSTWFNPLKIETLLLTGKLNNVEKEVIYKKINSAKPLILVGTHALFQKQVKFNKLGLIIIDEQHRFGVEQREALLNKSRSGNIHAHQLLMTATPIPRTLAMTAYSQLDISTLRNLPKGRKKVATHVIADTRRDEIVRRIGDVFRDGGQIYWVCPLIEESEKLEKEAATSIADKLSKVLPEMNVGLIHGKLSEPEKYDVMESFVNSRINLLVATTVIEVGVDVPDAALIVIENAEHLGLSQLHQLRGRVGRGDKKANCILLYQNPLSEIAKERLEIIRNTNDGFKIAELDLKLRGPGEFLGKRQSGIIQFKIANLMRDSNLIPQVNDAASRLQGLHERTKELLINRWMMMPYLKSLNQKSNETD